MVNSIGVLIFLTFAQVAEITLASTSRSASGATGVLSCYELFAFARRQNSQNTAALSRGKVKVLDPSAWMTGASPPAAANRFRFLRICYQLILPVFSFCCRQR